MSIEDTIKEKIRDNSRDRISYIHPIIDDKKIASYISAYANTNGGILVFGVHDDGSDLHVKKSVFKITEKELDIQNLLSSHVEMNFGSMFYERDKKIEYIEVCKSVDRISVNGVEYTMCKEQRPVPVTFKTIFLSYSHKDDFIADSIEDGLNRYTRNINISRDIRSVGYRQSFSDFMSTISGHDYVISIVSDNYLKSINCMREVVEVMKNRQYMDRLLYIIVKEDDLKVFGEDKCGWGASIYDLDGQSKYIEYWQFEEERIEEKMKGINTCNIKNFVEELQAIKRIQLDIQKFMRDLRDRKGISYSELISSEFKEILSAIGEQSIL